MEFDCCGLKVIYFLQYGSKKEERGEGALHSCPLKRDFGRLDFKVAIDPLVNTPLRWSNCPLGFVHLEVTMGGNIQVLTNPQSVTILSPNWL